MELRNIKGELCLAWIRLIDLLFFSVVSCSASGGSVVSKTLISYLLSLISLIGFNLIIRVQSLRTPLHIPLFCSAVTGSKAKGETADNLRFCFSAIYMRCIFASHLIRQSKPSENDCGQTNGV